MSETIILIERDPTNRRQLAEMLEREGRTIVVVDDPSGIPADLSVNAVLMNVQSLVNNDAAYKLDLFDIDAVAEMVVDALGDTTADVTIGVYATLPNRAYLLINVLENRGVKAFYRDFIRVSMWPEFQRDSPTPI